MEFRGFGSTGELRGLLASAAGTSLLDYGRRGYLSAVEQATRVYEPR
jgi:hypothetical protein